MFFFFTYVASPLLNTLVGSFGLVAAVPLTAKHRQTTEKLS